MRRILAIAWKDSLLRFTSPSEWLFFLVLPIVFTVILAGGTGAPDDARVVIGVVDQADSPQSQALVAALDASAAVRPDAMSLAEAEAALRDQRVNAYVLIPPAVDLAGLLQGDVTLEVRQRQNDVNALVAARAVAAAAEQLSDAVAIASLSADEAALRRPFATEADRAAYVSSALEETLTALRDAPARVAGVQGATDDPLDYDPAAHNSAGQLITWVFIPLIGISGFFALERQRGTLKRLFTTPTPRGTYLLGTILGQVATALLQMLVLVGFGIVVMRLDWGRSPAALAAMLVAAALAAAALGTTLGTFVKTEGQANGLSIMLGMVMALLGGCWYPMELFPAFMHTASRALPTAWAMEGLLNIVHRGQGLAAVLPHVGVLLGFAALFFAVGVARFRYE